MPNPRVRKLVLSVHLAVSGGWIGAVAVYLALGAIAVTSESETTVRGAWTAMETAGWFVIVPLAVASLLTGVGVATGARWGLFRHYWVAISFALTVLCVTVLILHMPSVSSSAAAARDAEGAALDALGGDLAHPAAGLVVLLVIHVLNVYKPAGMTRYGWRKQHERPADPM